MSFHQDFQHRSVLASPVKVATKVNTVFRTPTIIKRIPASISTDNTGINDLSLFTTQGPRNTPSTSTVFNTLKIGGGGFITGISIANDGTKVVRTDSYGAYLYTGNNWKQIVTTQTMPASVIGPALGEGVYEIEISPSNSSRIYMMNMGLMFRSDNKGSTWNYLNAFPQLNSGQGGEVFPNEGTYRLFGRKMACDPNNPDILYIGTGASGLFVTTDAGASFTNLSPATIPAPTYHGGVTITFDRHSPFSGGKTQGIYVSSVGNGVYQSTNGGSSWSLTTGTPTTHVHMISDSSGNVWLIDGNQGGTGNLNKWNGSVWSQISAVGNGGSAVAVDPLNVLHVIVGYPNGALNESSDGGSTWAGINTFTQTTGTNDVPWLSWANDGFMSLGDIMFDPVISNFLYFTSGIGVWTTSPTYNSSQATWTSLAAGIEQLIPNRVISPPGGNPVVGCQDRAIFYIDNPDTYKSTYSGIDRGVNEIIPCNSLDWASSSPSTIVAQVNTFNITAVDVSGKSIDGGQTFTPFATFPTGSPGTKPGGAISASTPSNILWMESNDGGPYFTSNGGITWSACTVPGVSQNDSGWHHSWFLNRQNICSDRVDSLTFYMFNSNFTTATSRGIWKSTDGGANFTHVNSGTFDNDQGNFNAKLLAVPEQSGHLFLTSGIGNFPHPNNQPFYRSTDHGTNWSTISNVKEVWAFGFGKSKSGGYPAIFIVGWVNGVFGIWRSDDNALTWNQISDGFPLGHFDFITCLDGDPNTFGTVYVGMGGSGYAYGKIQ